MTRKIILSADSTCDLPEELLEKYDVRCCPFSVNFRGKTYKDNVDICLKDIYDGYYEDGSLPQTAAINVGEYTEHFKQYTDKGYEVVHVTMGSALSCAHQNAQLAAKELTGVYVVDSCSVSSGIGQVVIKAGELLEQGVSAKDTCEEIQKFAHKVQVTFIVETLEFLAAGGRCPTIAAKAAGMLKCKPSVSLNNEDGHMEKSKIYRGHTDKTMVKFVRDVLTRYENVVPKYLFVSHAGISDDLKNKMSEEICKYVQFEKVYFVQASCTCCSHCGPGGYGLLFVAE